jgi:Glycosyl hydrolase family 12/Pectate lyase superfamily protein
MPQLNIIDTNEEEVQGLAQMAYLGNVLPGYNYGSQYGFLEFGTGTIGNLPFRVDQAGNVTANSYNMGGGGGDVISVFGRTGTVTAENGDYTAAQVTGAVEIGGDLGGTAASPTVAKLQGTSLSAPTGNPAAYLNGQLAWTVPTGSGGGGGGSGGSPPYISGSLNGQTGPQTVATGPYTFQVNEWDSSETYQLSYSYSPCYFKVTSSSIDNATDGSPGAYGSYYNGNHFGTSSASSPFPLYVPDIQSGQVTTSASGSYSGVTGYWDFAYDIWLCDTPTFDNSHRQELMIWLADSGTIQPSGSAGSTYSIGGYDWVLWSSGAGNTASFVCTSSQTTISDLDILPFIQRLITNGIMPSTYYLIDVEMGFEIWQGGVGLTLNSFSVSGNGTGVISSGIDWQSVLTYGADATGVNDSTAAFNAAVAALPSGGGVVYVPAGTYKLEGTVTFNQNQSMIGDGSTCVNINYTGNSSCIQAEVTSWTGGNQYAGSFTGFTVSCYGAGSDAVGFQYGNLQGINISDVAVYGASLYGLYCYNTSGWSEQSNIQMRLVQNGVAAYFQSGSCDYSNYDFTIVTEAGQGGVYLNNSAEMQGCNLRIRGNFYAKTGSNSAAVIGLETIGGSGGAYILNSLLDVAVETAGSGTGPYSIYMGSSSAVSQFAGHGVLSFLPATVAFQGVHNPSNNPIGFSGLINDVTLGKLENGDGFVVAGGTEWKSAGPGLSGTLYENTIYLQFGDIQEFQLAAGNNAVSFNGIGTSAKKLDLFIRQPSGGGATVGWPANVKWQNGTAPTLSVAGNAVDHIRLYYLPDTANFYGMLDGTNLS